MLNIVKYETALIEYVIKSYKYNCVKIHIKDLVQLNERLWEAMMRP